MARNQDYLLGLLAGLDVENSRKEVVEGVKQLRGLILDETKIDFEINDIVGIERLAREVRRLGESTNSIEQAFLTIEKVAGRMGKNSFGGVIDQNEIAKTTKSLVELIKLVEEADIGAKASIKNFKFDEKGVNKATVEIRDLEGTIKELKASFKKGDWEIDDLNVKTTFQKEFDGIISDYKRMQTEITSLSKKEGLGTASASERERLQGLIEEQVQREIRLKNEVKNLEQAGIISRKRALDLNEEILKTLEEINHQSQTSVTRAVNAEKLRTAKTALKDYKKASEELLKLEMKLQYAEDDYVATEAELQKIRNAKELMATNKGLINQYQSLRKELEEYESLSQDRLIAARSEEERKYADRRIKDIQKIYQEELAASREIRAEDLKRNQLTSLSDQIEIIELQRMRNLKVEAAKEELKDAQELERFKQKMFEEEKMMMNQIMDLEEEHARKVEELEERRLDKYGSKVVTGLTGEKIPDVSKINFENEEEVRQLVTSLGGAKASLEKLDFTTDEFNNALKVMKIRVNDSKNTVRILTYSFNEVEDAMRKAGEETKQNLTRNLSFFEGLKKSFNHTVTYGIAYKSLALLMQGMRESVRYIYDLNKELVQVAIVQGKTVSMVSDLRTQYSEWGIAMGKTSREIATVYTELIRQGLAMGAAEERLRTIISLSNAGQISAEESMKVITSSVNAMQVTQERAADVILKASQISASSVGELGEAFTKTASSAFAAGVEIEQVGALLATLIEVTQEGPSQLGTSLKTIIARFNRVNEDTGELNQELNEVQKAMESVGISFVDGAGQIRNTYDILEDLSGIWGDLSKNQQAYIATTAAGVRMQNRFFGIMNNFNRVQQINNQLLNAQGTLLEGQATFMTGLEGSVGRLKARWEAFVDSTLNSGLLIFFSDMLRTFIDIADAIGAANIAASTFVLQLLRIEGGMAMMMGLTAPFAEALVNTLKNLFGSTVQATNATAVLTKGYSYMAPVIHKAEASITSFSQAFKALAASEKLAGLGMKAFTGLLGFGIMIGTTIAIGKLVEMFVNLREAQKQARAELLEFNQALIDFNAEKAMIELDLEVDYARLEELTDKINKSASGKAAYALTPEEYQEWDQLNQQIIDANEGVLTVVDSSGKLIVDTRKTLEEQWIAIEDYMKGIAQRVREGDKDILKGLKEQYKDIFDDFEKQFPPRSYSDHSYRFTVYKSLQDKINESRESLSQFRSQIVNIVSIIEDIDFSAFSKLDSDALDALTYLVFADSEGDYEAGEALETFVAGLKEIEKFTTSEEYNTALEQLNRLKEQFSVGDIDEKEYSTQKAIIVNQIVQMINSAVKELESILGQKGTLISDMIADSLLGIIDDTKIKYDIEVFAKSSKEMYDSATQALKDHIEETATLKTAYDQLMSDEKLQPETFLELISLFPEIVNEVKNAGEVTLDVLDEIYKRKTDALKTDIDEMGLDDLRKEESRVKQALADRIRYGYGDSSIQQLQNELDAIRQYIFALEGAKSGLDETLETYDSTETVEIVELTADGFERINQLLKISNNEIERLEDKLNKLGETDLNRLEIEEKIKEEKYNQLRLLKSELEMKKASLEEAKNILNSIEVAEYGSMIDSDGILNTDFMKILQVYKQGLPNATAADSIERINEALSAFIDLSAEISDAQLNIDLFDLGLNSEAYEFQFTYLDGINSIVDEIAYRIENLNSKYEDSNIKLADKFELAKQINKEYENQNVILEKGLSAAETKLDQARAVLSNFGLINTDGRLVSNFDSVLNKMKKLYADNPMTLQVLDEGLSYYLEAQSEVGEITAKVNTNVATMKGYADSLRDAIELAKEETEELSSELTNILENKLPRALERSQARLSLLEKLRPEDVEAQNEILDENLQLLKDQAETLRNQAELAIKNLEISEKTTDEWAEGASELAASLENIESMNEELADLMKQRFGNFVDEEVKRLQEATEKLFEEAPHLRENQTLISLQDEDDLDSYLSAEAAALEIAEIKNDVLENQLALTLEQQEILERQNAIRQSDLDLVRASLEVQKAQIRLENLRNQKTVQQLIQQEDGSWQYEYVADVDEIEKAKTELENAQDNYQDAIKQRDESLQDDADLAAETNAENPLSSAAAAFIAEQRNTATQYNSEADARLDAIAEKAKNGYYDSAEDMGIDLSQVAFDKDLNQKLYEILPVFQNLAEAGYYDETTLTRLIHRINNAKTPYEKLMLVRSELEDLKATEGLELTNDISGILNGGLLMSKFESDEEFWLSKLQALADQDQTMETRLQQIRAIVDPAERLKALQDFGSTYLSADEIDKGTTFGVDNFNAYLTGQNSHILAMLQQAVDEEIYAQADMDSLIAQVEAESSNSLDKFIGLSRILGTAQAKGLSQTEPLYVDNLVDLTGVAKTVSEEISTMEDALRDAVNQGYLTQNEYDTISESLIGALPYDKIISLRAALSELTRTTEFETDLMQEHFDGLDLGLPMDELITQYEQYMLETDKIIQDSFVENTETRMMELIQDARELGLALGESLAEGLSTELDALIAKIEGYIEEVAELNDISSSYGGSEVDINNNNPVKPPTPGTENSTAPPKNIFGKADQIMYEQLDPNDLSEINRMTNEWKQADREYRAGKIELPEATARKKAAHDAVEAIRAKYNYSGGESGSSFILDGVDLTAFLEDEDLTFSDLEKLKEGYYSRIEGTQKFKHSAMTSAEVAAIRDAGIKWAQLDADLKAGILSPTDAELKKNALVEEVSEIRSKYGFSGGADGSRLVINGKDITDLIGSDGIISFKDAISLDTGGFTGEFGNEGRLAFLHEKELVLNKVDTANILEAVKAVRKISQNLFNKTNISNGGNVEYNIKADFPNATNMNEIQSALLGLEQVAKQKIGG